MPTVEHVVFIPGVFVIGLFADTLPAEDARRAAELVADERATLAGETSLQTLA